MAGRRSQRRKHGRRLKKSVPVAGSLQLNAARAHLTLARKDALEKGHNLERFMPHVDDYVAPCTACGGIAIVTENGWGGELFMDKCWGPVTLPKLKGLAERLMAEKGHIVYQQAWRLRPATDDSAPKPTLTCPVCSGCTRVSLKAFSPGRYMDGLATEMSCQEIFMLTRPVQEYQRDRNVHLSMPIQPGNIV